MVKPRKSRAKIAIIGAGFFGLYIAKKLSEKGCEIIVFEKSANPMQRASTKNQARVHRGYHYPRSLLTGLRSRISFPKFSKEFEDCIETSFTKLYMVSSRYGKITANQFQSFCNRIDAPCVQVYGQYSHLINPNLVDGIFKVEEYAFNSEALAGKILKELGEAKVKIKTSCEVVRIESNPTKNQMLLVNWIDENNCSQISEVDHVFNCAYSEINRINLNSNLSIIELKHELAEMILVEPPKELQGLGITLMCGPFFSLMPYPAKNCYSLSHVRYTPHLSWNEKTGVDVQSMSQKSSELDSNCELMVRDAARYLPSIKNINKIDSLWEIKTVLPRSETDDSRPILFRQNHGGLKNYHCIMGGKIDNVYDVIDEIDAHELV